MILMGDEVRRTQYGNNNAYCQNNTVSWFDWDLVNKHADVLRFTKLLIERRLLRNMERGKRISLNQLLRQAKFTWHGVKLNQPDWSNDSHSVSFTAEIQNDKLLFHMILNTHWESLDFELPPVNNMGNNFWHCWIDTAAESPNDIVDWQISPAIQTSYYPAKPHSVVMLFAGN